MSAPPTPATLAALGRPLAIVDVGAHPGDGGAPFWDALVAQGGATVLGFEPQPDGLAAARARARPGETFRSEVLGDGGPATLHRCQAPGMTSVLEPDPEALALFHGFPQWGQVQERIPVQTTRLDAIAAARPCDLLKLDVQGGELQVLRGAGDILDEAVIVQVEVSFHPLYRGQPPFAEIDGWLRARGFALHTFATLDRRPVAPVTFGPDPTAGGHQLLEADAVYVRDLPHFDRASAPQLRALALGLAQVYGSTDLAQRVIARHDARFGTALWRPWLVATGLAAPT